MRRRPLLISLVAALSLGASLLAVTAQADTVRAKPGTHRFSTADAMVPVVDGPADDHAVTIDTRLYVPDNATRRTPQPAILMTHGFGLN